MSLSTEAGDRVDLLLLYPLHDVKSYQPIGLPQLAGFLLAEGYGVKILDSVVLEYDFNQVCSHIRQIHPRIIGVSIPFTEMIKNGVEMLKLCRREFPDTLLICGGYHPRIRPEDIIDFCDLIVIGEGEVTTSELIRKYISGQDIYDIKGITYKKNREIILNPPRDLLQDVNLPFPAWHLIPVEKYKMTLYLSTGEVAFPLQTGYGCPFACTFCCNSKLHERTRNKDIRHVVNEIKYVVERFGVCGFHIWDETFTLSKTRVEEFCQKIIEDGPNIHWSAQTRANLLDRGLLQLMKKAGCVRISIGVESGDPHVLESINKKIDLQDVVRAISFAKDVGIVSYAGLMIGHPDDTPGTISRTISLASELNPDFVGFRCAIPYPGCEFRDIAERKGGILTNDFSQYRDDKIVYVPPGLAGYDLKKVRQVAYTYFYWQNPERISRVLKQNFLELFRDTLEYGPEIYLAKENGKPVSAEELLEKYCKTSSRSETHMADYGV